MNPPRPSEPGSEAATTQPQSTLALAQSSSGESLADLISLWYALRYHRWINMEFILVWVAAVLVPRPFYFIPIFAVHAGVTGWFLWERVRVLRLSRAHLAEVVFHAALSLLKRDLPPPGGWEWIRAAIVRNNSILNCVRDPLFSAASGLVLLCMIFAFRPFVTLTFTFLGLILGAVLVWCAIMVAVGLAFRRVQRHLRWLLLEERCGACGYPRVVETDATLTTAACPECGTLTLRA